MTTTNTLKSLGAEPQFGQRSISAKVLIQKYPEKPFHIIGVTTKRIKNAYAKTPDDPEEVDILNITTKEPWSVLSDTGEAEDVYVISTGSETIKSTLTKATVVAALADGGQIGPVVIKTNVGKSNTTYYYIDDAEKAGEDE